MACVPAASILALREAVNLAAPQRNKASDGICPSKAHTAANPTSLHETGSAIDITHDPAGGFDAGRLFAAIVSAKPTGYVAEVIFNSQIASPKENWKVRPYTGRNNHSTHIHIGVTPLGRTWVLLARFVGTSAEGGVHNFLPGPPILIDPGGVATRGSEVIAESPVGDAIGGVVDGAQQLGALATFLTDRDNWRRLALFTGGAMAAGIGLAIMLGDLGLDRGTAALNELGIEPEQVAAAAEAIK